MIYNRTHLGDVVRDMRALEPAIVAACDEETVLRLAEIVVRHPCSPREVCRAFNAYPHLPLLEKLAELCDFGYGLEGLALLIRAYHPVRMAELERSTKSLADKLAEAGP